jgi:hypothetical protein
MVDRKPGFIYIYSDTLKEEIAFSKKTGSLWCEDGVKYSPEEIVILAESGVVIPLQVHLLKKIFKGSEIVRYI